MAWTLGPDFIPRFPWQVRPRTQARTRSYGSSTSHATRQTKRFAPYLRRFDKNRVRRVFHRSRHDPRTEAPPNVRGREDRFLSTGRELDSMRVMFPLAEPVSADWTSRSVRTRPVRAPGRLTWKRTSRLLTDCGPLSTYCGMACTFEHQRKRTPAPVFLCRLVLFLLAPARHRAECGNCAQSYLVHVVGEARYHIFSKSHSNEKMEKGPLTRVEAVPGGSSAPTSPLGACSLKYWVR